MISIKLESGESVNLESVTVDEVKGRHRKSECLVCIGTIELVVLEAPASLIKRIRADGGDPVVPAKKADSHFEPAPETADSGEAAPEGETLPVGGEDEGGLST